MENKREKARKGIKKGVERPNKLDLTDTDRYKEILERQLQG